MDSPEQAVRMVLDSVHSPDRKATYNLIRKVRGRDKYDLLEVFGWDPAVIGVTIKNLVTGEEIRSYSFNGNDYLPDSLPGDYYEGPVHILRGEDISIPGN
jgi:hypothetical protein